MQKILLVFSFLFILFTVRAEVEEVTPLEEVLLTADLIVTGKVRTSTYDVFRVEIAQVIVDKGFGLKKGDYLKIKNFHHRGCFGNFNIQEIDSAVFALKKEKYLWKLVDTEQLLPINSGKVVGSFMHCSWLAPTQDWVKNIREIRQEFSYSQSEGYRFLHELKCEPAQYASAWPLKKYLLKFMFECKEIEMIEEMQCEWAVVEPEEFDLAQERSDSAIVDFPAVEAIPPEGIYDTLNTIVNRLKKRFPMLAENEMEGKVFVQFVIERDGSVSNAKVLRSFYPPLNKEVKKEMNRLALFTPARDHLNRTVRTRFIVPLNFKLSRE